MRIVSNFKDYYDVLQDPTDKDLTYVRMKKLLTPEDPVSRELLLYRFEVPETFEWRHHRKMGQDLADRVSREWNGQIVPTYEDPRVGHGYYPSYSRFQSVVVLFCGKLYTGIRYNERWRGLAGRSDATFFATTDGMVSKVYWNAQSFAGDFHQVSRNGKPITDPSQLRSGNTTLSRLNQQSNRTLMDLHFKTGCPVLALEKEPEPKLGASGQRRREIVAALNPNLRDLQFFRIVDVNIAFQELSMFLGGVLANNDRPEPVDNKYKILAHGFDLKESFRKGPTKEHR
jgi:hypothetical protein